MSDDNVSDLLEQLLRGSALVLVGNILGAGSAFLSRIVVANHLGPAGYGEIVLGLTILNILTVVSLLGIPEGLARQLPRTENKQQMFVGAAAVPVLVSAILTVVFISTLPITGQLFPDSDITAVLTVFAAGVPLLVFVKLTVGGLRGIQDVTSRVLVHNISYQTITMVFIGIAVFLGLNSFQISFVWVTALGVAFIVSLLVVRRTSLSSTTPGLTETGLGFWYSSNVGKLVLFSMPLMASQGADIVLQYFDNLVIGYYMPSSAVGVYDASFTIARVPMLALWSLGFLFLPIISELDAGANYGEMDRLYKLSTKWLAFVTLPIILLMVSFPGEVLQIIFGQEFIVGKEALRIIIIGFFIHILVGESEWTLVAIGESGMILAGNIAHLVLNIILNIALVPMLGITGAALASALSYAGVNIIWSYRLFVRTSIHPFYKSYVRPTVITAVLYAGLYYLIQGNQLGPLVTVVSMGFMLVVLHGSVILLTGGIDDEDADLLARALGAFN